MQREASPFPCSQEALAGRRDELRRRMAAQGVDAALLSHSRDVLYYTGTAQPSNLAVFAARDPVLFARRAGEFVERDVDGLDVRMEASFSGPVREFAAAGSGGRRLGVALDVVPAALVRRLEAMLPGWEVVDISPVVLAQRSVKQPCEIEAMERAASLAAVADETIRRVLVPGLTPVELAAEVGRSLRRAGAEEILFFRRWDAWLQPSGIFASGEEAAKISGHAMTVTGVGSSTALPWGPSWRPVEKGDALYADLGINVGGYHADFTRSYCLGPAGQRARDLFAAALGAQEAAFAAMVPGAPASAPMLAALDAVRSLGLDSFFQGFGTQQGDYVGHGLGLELDEPPTLTSRVQWPLEAGMCLAVETKLIVPGWGAVGVEDTVVLEAQGPRVLTHVPRELVEL
jgi:Xaa-Pro aminopeptidase